MQTVKFMGQLITRSDILVSLQEFDANYPNTNDYDEWLDNVKYVYALRQGGRLYPCKRILSDVSGIPITEFSGGDQTNHVFVTLQFEIIKKPINGSFREVEQAKENEKNRRLLLWQRLNEKGGPLKVSPELLRDLRIYGGAQGIWRDKSVTRSCATDGATISLLHTGAYYEDDLFQDGIIYHYPNTNRLGHDAAEIQATKVTNHLKLPIFVITLSTPDSTTRDVHMGFVEEWDDVEKLFLISFDNEPPSNDWEIDNNPFELDEERIEKFRPAPTRTNQSRFRLRVTRRYGHKCALCNLNIPELLDAVHIKPYGLGGTDDPRNGLVLCALHHRAFDSNFFSFNPDNLTVHCKSDGPNVNDLMITKTEISHLENKPHSDSLIWHWDKWKRQTAH